MKLYITKTQSVNDMVNGLNAYAEKLNVSLVNRIPEDVNKLDDVFNDGGEGRCEHFTDLSLAYALQFGTELEDYSAKNGVQAHSWKCINSAMKRLQKQWNKKTE